jgi:subtilisin family serine protease
MRTNLKKVRRAIAATLAGATLVGLLLAASSISASSPAAAMGFRFSAPMRMPSVRAPGVAGRVAGGSRFRGSRFNGHPGRVVTREYGGRFHPIYTWRHVGISNRPYVPNGGLVTTIPGPGGAATAPGIAARGGLPPPGEQRFVPDEVIVQFSTGSFQQAILRLTRIYNLSALESQSFPLIGMRLVRLHIGSGRSVRNVLAALQAQRIVAFAQPNYLFALTEDTSKAASAAQGDPAQYVLAKLQVEAAQQIATGKDVPVAVIDSEIDAKHPDLSGSVARSFDALPGDDAPQLHGTEMAGAIASHGKLLGIAPGVELLAAHAFDDRSSGTSFAIYKSLEWAADNGARVVNMSFAGPEDPTLHTMLAAAFAKDIVLVAAAGNGGPISTPLYPAADPDVIAVSATDIDDHLFKMSNRGRYIAIAAPGVEIIALAPGDTYQITTGTSVAAAHVSAVAALLLQHDPSLKPADIRNILIGTAKPLPDFGKPGALGEGDPGLVNAYRALTTPAKTVSTDPSGEQAKR